MGMCHLRAKLFKLARRSKREIDWTRARQLRQLTNYVVRKAKSNYLKEILDRDKGDSKRFWLHVNNLLPKKGKDIIVIRDNVRKIGLKEKEACGHINKFFLFDWFRNGEKAS